MLNAIAGTLVGYLLSNHGQQYGQGRRTTPIPASSQLAGLDRLRGPRGPIWTLTCSRSLVGRRLLACSQPHPLRLRPPRHRRVEDAAVASGVKVKRMVVISMLLSGAIAGLIWMPALFGGADYYGPPFQRRPRLHRHRGRAARPQPAARHRLRCAALRLAQRAGQPARPDRRHLPVDRPDHPGRRRPRRRHRLRGRAPVAGRPRAAIPARGRAGTPERGPRQSDGRPRHGTTTAPSPRGQVAGVAARLLPDRDRPRCSSIAASV